MDRNTPIGDNSTWVYRFFLGDQGLNALFRGGICPNQHTNIYAGGDGTARADFFAADINLGTGVDHSIFDDDGSSIIHEKPDIYVEGPTSAIESPAGLLDATRNTAVKENR